MNKLIDDQLQFGNRGKSRPLEYSRFQSQRYMIDRGIASIRGASTVCTTDYQAASLNLVTFSLKISKIKYLSLLQNKRKRTSAYSTARQVKS